MPSYNYYVAQHIATRVDTISPIIHRFDGSDVIALFQNATYANASGNRTIDYDPDRSASTPLIGPFAAGEKATTIINGYRFIQIEEAGTNISTNSGTPIANWTATRASWDVTPDYLGGVMGNLIEDNTLAQNHRCEEGTSSFDGSSEYCISFYAKAKERFRFQVYGTSGAFPAAVTADYNINTGLVTGTGANTNNAGIYLVKDGVSRCWMTATSDAAATSRWECRMMDAAGNVVYDGDNTSGMWFWGSQYEIGSFPSSYIPTIGSSATRDKDQLYWASADVPGALRGKFTFQWIPFADHTDGTAKYLFDFKDSGASIRVNMFFRPAGNNFRLLIDGVTYDSGAVTFSPRQTLTFTVDPSIGTVELSGFTTGNGTLTGVPWTTSAGNVGWGMTEPGSVQCNGLISEPYRS
jgi:hypothetical protein